MRARDRDHGDDRRRRTVFHDSQIGVSIDLNQVLLEVQQRLQLHIQNGVDHTIVINVAYVRQDRRDGIRSRGVHNEHVGDTLRHTVDDPTRIQRGRTGDCVIHSTSPAVDSVDARKREPEQRFLAVVTVSRVQSTQRDVSTGRIRGRTGHTTSTAKAQRVSTGTEVDIGCGRHTVSDTGTVVKNHSVVTTAQADWSVHHHAQAQSHEIVQNAAGDCRSILVGVHDEIVAAVTGNEVLEVVERQRGPWQRTCHRIGFERARILPQHERARHGGGDQVHDRVGQRITLRCPFNDVDVGKATRYATVRVNVNRPSVAQCGHRGVHDDGSSCDHQIAEVQRVDAADTTINRSVHGDSRGQHELVVR